VRHRISIGILWALTACACASAPATTPAVPAAALAPTFEQKMAWILRLEDQRVLKDPETPAADLVRLLTDGQARVRRRAALAIGRVGLTSGIAPLVMVLGDTEPEVRQMAAFALGLIGDRQARDPLLMSLTDQSPLVQSSAAEALGLIGDPAAAAGVGRLVASVVQSGALTSSPAEDDEARRDTPASAFRLGVFALVRLKAYDQLAAAVLDPSGRPRVTWWPVAFALQRLEDKRALPALLALAGDSNPYTRAFAVKGLGSLKDRMATPVVLPLLSSRDTGVAIEAIRAVGKIGDPVAAEPLLRLVQGRGVAQQMRVEAVAALGGLRGPGIADNLVDVIGDRDPLVRAAALRSASTADPEGFVTILSGLDPDPDWRTRAALASLLGELPRQTALPRLTRMLDDTDQRVIAAVLTSLVNIGAPQCRRHPARPSQGR
jgi:HEAT repeat protein